MHFTDYIQDAINRSGSVLVAGFDPVLETFPAVFLDEASKEASSEEAIFKALTGYYGFALRTLSKQVTAIKPNIAFFEQYGIGGLRALSYLLSLSRDLKIPSILDAKRGDIGTTAEAYARAYLSGTSYNGKAFTAFEADSLTVNPFLGFDTVKVFLDACAAHGKGIFVLVKTSNPGSKDLQDLTTKSGHSVSQTLASWIAEQSKSLMGRCNLSGLGAVVGATHPKELSELRKAMPNTLFLIPGMGAQGGTAKDVVGGFLSYNQGALINLSRGLLSAFTKKDAPKEILAAELTALAVKYKSELDSAQRDAAGGAL